MSNGAVQTGISFGAIIFTLPYEIFFSNMSESELGIPVSASEVASTTASLIATALSSNVSVGKKSKHLQITVRTAPPGLRYFTSTKAIFLLFHAHSFSPATLLVYRPVSLKGLVCKRVHNLEIWLGC